MTFVEHDNFKQSDLEALQALMPEGKEIALVSFYEGEARYAVQVMCLLQGHTRRGESEVSFKEAALAAVALFETLPFGQDVFDEEMGRLWRATHGDAVN